MLKATEVALREIGEQFDADLYPVVKNGGIVVPRAPAISPMILGKEIQNGKSRKGRSEAGAWAGASAGQGAAGGPRAARGSGAAAASAPVARADLREHYEEELLGGLQDAYPGTRHWLKDDGLWLIAESSLLPGLSFKANFVVAIPFDGPCARSWGYWGGAASGFSWIGPRHTNYPDGSICAFDNADHAWHIGKPIISLLDLYSSWAVRHLYLQAFGRWPGYQSVQVPYERVLELREDEYCGCENFGRRYAECCRERDLALHLVNAAINFDKRSGGGHRTPPVEISKFVLDQSSPPQMSDLGI